MVFYSDVRLCMYDKYAIHLAHCRENPIPRRRLFSHVPWSSCGEKEQKTNNFLTTKQSYNQQRCAVHSTFWLLKIPSYLSWPSINRRTCLLRTYLPLNTLNWLLSSYSKWFCVRIVPKVSYVFRWSTLCNEAITDLSPKGPLSHQYGHILTSCFIDTILIPLCTWLYLLFLLKICIVSAIFKSRAWTRSSLGDVNSKLPKRHGKVHRVSKVFYGLLILAQALMCTLEIVRLSLASLGIGLLPFTYIGLLVAFALRFSRRIPIPIENWRWASLFLWVLLAVANGVKLTEELKEGIKERKGTKYPMIDQITDVAVMIGVYVVLSVLEVCLKPWRLYGSNW